MSRCERRWPGDVGAERLAGHFALLALRGSSSWVERSEDCSCSGTSGADGGGWSAKFRCGFRTLGT